MRILSKQPMENLLHTYVVNDEKVESRFFLFFRQERRFDDENNLTNHSAQFSDMNLFILVFIRSQNSFFFLLRKLFVLSLTFVRSLCCYSMCFTSDVIYSHSLVNVFSDNVIACFFFLLNSRYEILHRSFQ